MPSPVVWKIAMEPDERSYPEFVRYHLSELERAVIDAAIRWRSNPDEYPANAYADLITATERLLAAREGK